jgi:hypothetical protein
MSRMGGDAGEDIDQPSLRIDAIHLGRDDEAVHGGRASSAAIRSTEEPRLSSKSYLQCFPADLNLGDSQRFSHRRVWPH